MTYGSPFIEPKVINLNPNLKRIRLPVHGQGIFVFTNRNTVNPVVFFIYNKNKTDGFKVKFNEKRIVLIRLSTKERLVDKKNKVGLLDIENAFYFISIDSQNQIIKAGYGEARTEDIQYQYKLQENDRSFLESLTQIQLQPVSYIMPLRIVRDPIVDKIPLVIKDTNELTMEDIAKNKYMPVANLSPVGQQLYNCISGTNFKLNTDDFPEFGQAIEGSIRTPGLWCYEKLKEKSTEFNPDVPNIDETYLRITLGKNNGESPGIPYVMEIWPVGHYSPIHNHSSANAVIRVLQGEINVKLYPFLTDKLDPFGEANFHFDQSTWISTNLNQIHQLKNMEYNSMACITIQCYMYDETDNLHYDYFDYVDEQGKIQHYNPDSDMGFVEFKEIIKQEWLNK